MGSGRPRPSGRNLRNFHPYAYPYGYKLVLPDDEVEPAPGLEPKK
mgnify:CR=1 FL=1